VDQKALKALVERYFLGEGTGEEVSLKGLRVALVYGPGQEALAQRAEERLAALGLKVLPHPTDLPPGRTEVLENGPGFAAEALGKALGVPYRVSGEALLGADLTLRLGGDFPL